ncbi:MAG: hypothetical protein FJY92_11045 [Candidatus Hydrogenedentes bacterium]|nr:hypothetical protein [Candidatus Hydrogenedentota bacterium]
MPDSGVTHNLRHLAAWCALAALGIGVLFGLRHAGQSVLSTSEAKAALAAIQEEYRRGEIVEAQKQLYGFITRRPEMCSSVLEQFGPHVMGMPRVFALLNSPPGKDAPDPVTGPGPTDEIVIAIWSGDTARAVDRFDASATESELSPSLVLWRARVAFRSGDLKDAESWFSRYWQRESRQRGKRAAQILGNRSTASPGPSETLDEPIYALLWDGLWTEAFEAARSAGGQTYPALLCNAIETDLGGDAAAALPLYERVLTDRPGDYLASLRVHALRG